LPSLPAAHCVLTVMRGVTAARAGMAAPANVAADPASSARRLIWKPGIYSSHDYSTGAIQRHFAARPVMEDRMSTIMVSIFLMRLMMRNRSLSEGDNLT
jgi:hypothetical protein